MAEQDLDREYANIKAGVEGMIDDVPSPSDTETLQASEAQDYNTPSTETTETNYSETPSYNEAVDYGNSSGQPTVDASRIHEIIESVISEKLDDLTGNLGDLSAWKEKINHDVVSMKQEILRIEEKFENLQNAIIGRVKEYDKGISNVHTEMKALEKVLERILEPLVTNIKELSKITEDMKKSKK